MSDFKIGDRVQVRPHTASYGTETWSGPATVTAETVDGYLIAKFDHNYIKGGFKPEELEAVEVSE